MDLALVGSLGVVSDFLGVPKSWSGASYFSLVILLALLMVNSQELCDRNKEMYRKISAP